MAHIWIDEWRIRVEVPGIAPTVNEKISEERWMRVILTGSDHLHTWAKLFEYIIAGKARLHPPGPRPRNTVAFTVIDIPASRPNISRRPLPCKTES